VLRAGAGQALPGAILEVLRQERVTCGWVRGSGVLRDVELRAYDGGLGTLGRTRAIAGPVHALTIEGSVGLTDGEPSVSLRAVVARESDRGLEALAGELTSAQTVAVEVFVTVLDDVTLERALDERAGVWLLGEPAPAPAGGAPLPPSPKPHAPAAPWAVALEASERVEPARRVATGTASTGVPMPVRPPKPGIDLDTVAPERGDIVEHFAFGPCEVVRSDGDRLHLRVHKDGRIREIALEMLRVTPLPGSEEGARRFKLERRI
jgi:predicted DNA-binding protein with PD1-like motif